MPKDLRTFLDIARPLGPHYYLEAGRPVKPEMELAALQHKLAKEGRNPIVYCPRVAGSKLSAVTNVLGNYDLMGLALDIPALKLRSGARELIVRTYGERMRHFHGPMEVPAGLAPVHDRVLTGEQADLSLLPIMYHAPLNSARYVTAGMTIVKDPDSGIPNVGMYRHELKGPRRLAAAITTGHHGDLIAKRYAALGKQMEVVTFIGHHPACVMAASAQRPDKRGENELGLMGALLGEPLEVIRGLTVDLPVPARAEIAIEGVIDPLEMDREGPFSEGAGYYGEGKPCYVIEVTAITMRRDAIYQDLHPTHAEHLFAFLLEREHNMLRAARAAVPGVLNVHLGPEDRCAKNLIYLSVKKEVNDDGVRAGIEALKTGFSRAAIVVDDDIDVFDESEVLWAVCTRLGRVALVDTKTGQLAGLDNPADLRIPSNPIGSRPGMLLLLDATRPLGISSPQRVELPAELLTRISLDDYFPCR